MFSWPRGEIRRPPVSGSGACACLLVEGYVSLRREGRSQMGIYVIALQSLVFGPVPDPAWGRGAGVGVPGVEDPGPKKGISRRKISVQEVD